MSEPDDLALLREYAAQNSESAFAKLVSRRVDFVYSAALRQTQNPHLAEEITQAVFILLAQKAGKISDKTILTGWLFKTTRFTALAQIRAETKRARQQKEFQMQSHLEYTPDDLSRRSEAEVELWNQMSPLLDEALAALGETDRQAVLLRLFENKSLAEVGNFLGIGEDTARKRISRALEKLHRHFNRRDVNSTTAIIAGAISTNSIHAAPIGLAKTISTVAVVKGAMASTSTLTLIKGALKIMAWTKVKTAIVASAVALLAAGATTLTVTKIQSRIRNREVATALLRMHQQWAANDYRAKGMEVPKSLNNDKVSAYSAGILGAYIQYHFQKNGIDWTKRFHILRENTNSTIWTLYEIAEPNNTNLLNMAWRHKLITVNSNP
jgi:RNA polymerase sigma factor (sigma-70 family)